MEPSFNLNVVGGLATPKQRLLNILTEKTKGWNVLKSDSRICTRSFSTMLLPIRCVASDTSRPLFKRYALNVNGSVRFKKPKQKTLRGYHAKVRSVVCLPERVGDLTACSCCCCCFLPASCASPIAPPALVLPKFAAQDPVYPHAKSKKS